MVENGKTTCRPGEERVGQKRHSVWLDPIKVDPTPPTSPLAFFFSTGGESESLVYPFYFGNITPRARAVQRQSFVAGYEGFIYIFPFWLPITLSGKPRTSPRLIFSATTGRPASSPAATAFLVQGTVECVPKQ